MDAYLRGYYGYKNFGDEMLFFGVVEWIMKNYPIDTLYVEVGDKKWMDGWIEKNIEKLKYGNVEKGGSLLEKNVEKLKYGNIEKGRNLFDRIKIVEIRQHKWKLLTHIINFLGMGKYRKLFKFFGGGEVLSDERPFPHDGRNIPLLFHATVRRKQFVLLGGIGKPSNRRTRFLYHLLLPRAQEIIIRDGTSYDIVKQMGYKAKLHHDFAENIIKGGKVEKLKGGKLIKEKYILININKKMLNTKHIHAIHVFCEQYSDCIKIFFPCDMGDDATCYDTLKKTIPDLLYYDRTKKTLAESLSLFHHSRGGIGCRLHFLLPLKIYGKEFEAIPYADKINKLILK